MGNRLRQGIAEQAKEYGVKLRHSGPPQMSLILFDDDPRHEKGIAFCAAASQRGVYLHPRAAAGSSVVRVRPASHRHCH